MDITHQPHRSDKLQTLIAIPNPCDYIMNLRARALIFNQHNAVRHSYAGHGTFLQRTPIPRVCVRPCCKATAPSWL
jgi:hypothetical protein